MKILRADKEYREAVAKNTLEYKKDIKNIINETTKAAYKAGDDIVAKAGDMSWHSDLAIWKDAGIKLAKNNNALSQLVAAAQRQLRGDLKNLTRTTGFKGFVGYESVQNLYRTELDKAVIKIMSGTLSQDQVEREVVRNLARSGLRSIDYANGRSDTLDTAVARALRTGCQQMTAAIQDENMESTGENLVYVQEHAGARNEGNGVANHAKWQGKVYYIKPGHDYSEEEARLGYEIKDLWVETGYSIDGAHANNPLGLFGYNCRHLYFPWFEGISELPKSQKKRPSVEYEGRQLDYYEQTQEARKQERKIRALKREKEALDTLGLDSSEVSLKIRQATNKYDAFTSRCNMPRGNRTRYEAGTGDITKTEAYNDFNKVLLNDKVSGKLLSGARITNPNDERAVRFAEIFYNEVKFHTKDCEKISKVTGVPENYIRKIKNYLFYTDSFVPDCAIAQSWQRLENGKHIKPHDLTLIHHELYEMEIKRENPGTEHYVAHEIATKKYNYQKEVEDYYGKLDKC